MARPPKDPHLRMDEEIRIPLTEVQKASIRRSADAEGMDMAEWIRRIILPLANKSGGRGNRTRSAKAGP